MIETVGLDVQVSSRDLRDINSFFVRLAPEAIDRAIDRAINKTARYTMTRIARESALAIGVKLKALRGRLRSYTKERGGLSVKKKIWFGANPMSAKYLGKPTRVTGGIRTGNRLWAGAFSNEKLGGHVFRRTTPNRLPIDRMDENIHDSVNAAMIDAYDYAEARVMVVLQQELNYEFLKLIGRAK